MFLFSIIPVPSQGTSPDHSNLISVNEDKIIKLESLLADLILRPDQLVDVDSNQPGVQVFIGPGGETVTADANIVRQELYRLRAEDLKLKEEQHCTVDYKNVSIRLKEIQAEIIIANKREHDSEELLKHLTATLQNNHDVDALIKQVLANPQNNHDVVAVLKALYGMKTLKIVLAESEAFWKEASNNDMKHITQEPALKKKRI